MLDFTTLIIDGVDWKKIDISNRLGFNYYVRLYSSLVEIYQQINKMEMSKWWYMWSGTICTILKMWKTPKSECYF